MIPNPPITKKYAFLVFSPSFLVMMTLFVYTYSAGSQWMYDVLVSIAVLGTLVAINKWVKLGIMGWIFVSLACTIHLMGMFDAYSWSYSFIGYDNIVHIFSCMTIAYVCFNFLARKLLVRKHKSYFLGKLDETTLLIIVLVISVVSLLGFMLELVEFVGTTMFEPGEGVFFEGSGDSDTVLGVEGNYADTMTDLIWNLVGGILGVVLYYFGTYRLKPWLRYQ